VPFPSLPPRFPSTSPGPAPSATTGKDKANEWHGKKIDVEKGLYGQKRGNSNNYFLSRAASFQQSAFSGQRRKRQTAFRHGIRPCHYLIPDELMADR
jgi:hypothetical protein